MTKDIFLKLIFTILKIYMIFTMIYLFYLKEQKLVCKKKKEYIIHIRNFKQALNHGLVLKKVHIKFNQEARLTF